MSFSVHDDKMIRIEKTYTKGPMHAQQYINDLIERKVPYFVNILGSTFIISDTQVYPPGKLTTLFATHLLNNELIKNKVIVDAGAGCFALGILAAQAGAKEVIGTDISQAAVNCARENIILNKVNSNARILKENGLTKLLPEYMRKVDLLLSGAPWESISQIQFENIPEKRKFISLAFYDVEDRLITDVLKNGPLLLSPKGKILITASMRVIDRINQLCEKHKKIYRIIAEKDLHNDGNIHYILEILSSTTGLSVME